MENQRFNKEQFVRVTVAFDDYTLLADELNDHTGDPEMYRQTSRQFFIDPEYSPDFQEFLKAVNSGEFKDCDLIAFHLED